MPIIANVRLRDSMNTEVTKRFETETEVIATAQAAVAALLADFAAVSDLGIVNVTYSFTDDAEATDPGASSNVDVGATFTVELTAGGKAAHKIPGFPLSLVGSDRNIDVGGVEVAAYFANFEAAGEFRLSDGETITGPLKGKLDV